MIFGIDGLERSYLEERMADGAMPSFSRLYAEGVVSDMATQSPSFSPAIWTTLASGYKPAIHGVPGWTRADGTVPSGADVRVDRLWNRVSSEDQPVAVIGWLMTSPAEEVQGALLSERLVWHRTPDSYHPATPIPDNLLWRRQEGASWPPELAEPIGDMIPTKRWLARQPQGWQLNALGRGHHPLPKDETHLRVFEKLVNPLEARLGVLYWMSIDQISHLYWPFVVDEAVAIMEANPDARRRAYKRHPASKSGSDHKYFPWVKAPITGKQIALGRRWMEDTYTAADDALARVMAQVDPATTTLIVLSDHGFEAGAKMPALDARHRDVGFLAAWGRRAEQGTSSTKPHLLDLVPTICGLLDLEAAEDMPGRALTELFDVTPPRRGASWIRPEAPQAPSTEPPPEALQEQLKLLGYVE